jgi:ATP-dependent helicase/DNAse subunit B
MPLTLVLGPANSAKAGEMFGAYAAAAPRGALLIVPTYEDVRHYSRELAEQGTVLSSVLTFSGLIREIAQRGGYDGRQISALARERLLVAVLREQRFEVLAQSAQSPGFLVAAAALIGELERSLISPERFTDGLARWAAVDPWRERYAREVAGIYEAYARQLDGIGRVDRELHAWRALDALRTSPGRWGTDQVFFYGFDDLHPLERDAVETLALVAEAEVTLSLTYEAGRPALAARAEVVEELRPLAQRVIELPALDEHYAASSRRVLHHVERWLFAIAPERVDPGPAVRLLEAGGERAEAELVGAEILSLLRSGVAAEGIAVVCRSVTRSAPVIESVFSQYGIPVAVDRPIEFGQTPLGRTLLAMLRCALLGEQATAQDLLQYLRWPGVLHRVEVADALEAQVRRDRLTRAEDAWQRLGFELGEITALRQADDPLAELVRQARRLLALPHGASAPLLGPSERLDARALQEMLGALAELTELGLAPSGAELVGLLEQLPVKAESSIRPGAVQVSEPLAIRARRFQVVFVCGLQESEFPQPTSPEPFFSDESRRELFAAGGLRLRPVEDALVRERYLFYSAVSRATDQVVLSWRSSDEEGNLALRSPFIDDVAQLLTPEWVDRRRRRLLGDVVWPADEAPTERERRHSLAASAPQNASLGEEGPELRTLSETALRHVRHQQIVSGGALELYSDCPVKWLVERELAPPPLDPDPDPLARGGFIHQALEEVIGRLETSVSPESLPDAERILDDVLRELAPELSPHRSPAVRAAIVASIEADLRRYLRYEARQAPHWEPRGLELRFGFEDEEDSLPALVLGGGPEPLRVRGVIDRLDVDPSGSGQAIIRDYKSGPVRQEYQGARWSTDRRLQVALYMLAARALLGLTPVAGLYQPLGGNEVRARGLFLAGGSMGEGLVATDAREVSELDAELEDAAARAVQVAHTLRQGSLTPCPQTCSRYGCSFPGICRTEL